MYTLKRKFWLSIYLIITLIFNPVIPFYSEKGIWILIDTITIVIIFISLFITKSKKIVQMKKQNYQINDINENKTNFKKSLTIASTRLADGDEGDNVILS